MNDIEQRCVITCSEYSSCINTVAYARRGTFDIDWTCWSWTNTNHACYNSYILCGKSSSGRYTYQRFWYQPNGDRDNKEWLLSGGDAECLITNTDYPSL